MSNTLFPIVRYQRYYVGLWPGQMRGLTQKAWALGWSAGEQNDLQNEGGNGKSAIFSGDVPSKASI